MTSRLAIAEDSLLVREGIGRILRDAGFEVVGVAANVEELLELAERARPDVAGDIVGVVAHR
jgi:DNA-binding NarL/FixJ family response regulator